MKHSKKYFNEAVATMVGTIIGAGVLGIPFAMSQSGFLVGFVLIVVLGSILTLMNLFLAQVTLRTHGIHQLTGYAEEYLGIWGKRIMMFSMFTTIYGGLLAYLIGQGATLQALFGGEAFIWSLLFWAAGSCILYFGIGVIKEFEFVMILIIIGVVLLIAASSAPFISLESLQYYDVSKALIPYGVVFFSLLGATSIPQVRQIMMGHEKQMSSVIVLSMIIPIIIYALFAFVVIGVTGVSTTEVATVGLGQAIGPQMVLLGNIFAFFAMGTSFLTLGLAVKEMYIYDFKINPRIAWLAAILLPIIFFLLGFQNFIKTIGIVGAIAGGLEGILIVLMYWKAGKNGKRKSEIQLGKQYLGGITLIVLFLTGIFLTLF